MNSVNKDCDWDLRETVKATMDGFLLSLTGIEKIVIKNDVVFVLLKNKVFKRISQSLCNVDELDIKYIYNVKDFTYNNDFITIKHVYKTSISIRVININSIHSSEDMVLNRYYVLLSTLDCYYHSPTELVLLGDDTVTLYDYGENFLVPGESDLVIEKPLLAYKGIKYSLINKTLYSHRYMVQINGLSNAEILNPATRVRKYMVAEDVMVTYLKDNVLTVCGVSDFAEDIFTPLYSIENVHDYLISYTDIGEALYDTHIVLSLTHGRLQCVKFNDDLRLHHKTLWRTEYSLMNQMIDTNIKERTVDYRCGKALKRLSFKNRGKVTLEYVETQLTNVKYI